jgi:hypothetical protein
VVSPVAARRLRRRQDDKGLAEEFSLFCSLLMYGVERKPKVRVVGQAE